VEQNKGPDMNPHSYPHPVFNKGTKYIGWRKPFQYMLLGNVVVYLLKTETRSSMLVTMY
jgi:hypothetical protein